MGIKLNFEGVKFEIKEKERGGWGNKEGEINNEMFVEYFEKDRRRYMVDNI